MRDQASHSLCKRPRVFLDTPPIISHAFFEKERSPTRGRNIVRESAEKTFPRSAIFRLLVREIAGMIPLLMLGPFGAGGEERKHGDS